MKRILCSLCIGSLALAVTAWGQEVSEKTKSDSTTAARASGNTKATARPTAHVSSRPVNTRTYSSNRAPRTGVSSRPVNTRTYSRTPRTGSSAVAYRNNVGRTSAMTARERNVVAANRQRNVNINTQNNVVNRGRNPATINRQRNVAITNNWRNAQFSGQRYTAFRNYQRQWHDRTWWRSHFNTIVFVNGGWYFWNAGYWYPAWGYAPYAYYPYDGPIYGYNGLAPDQVVVDVQEQLQGDGYYAGPIDGVLGPMTRQAIANFQADHGLAVTSAVDEPTLATLGLA
jgi:peptidoglycan hydrolase-like protein with peptidoglycan-binding domain